MRKFTAAILSLLFISGFSVSASAKLIYVTNAGNNTISIIDSTKNEIINTIRVGVWPAGIAIDPSAKMAYVVNSNEGDSTVWVIDLASNSVVSKIKVGIGPMHIALDPAAGIGYATDTEFMSEGKNINKTLSVIDLKTNTVKNKIEVGIGPFDLKIAGNKLFVSN